MPDYAKATELATEVADKATAKSIRAWVIQNVDLIEKGLSDKTYEAYVQMLNDDCGFDINVSVFGNYLSDARKARNANPKKTQKPTAKHTGGTPEADWTDLEKKVGYRLSDEIREYVSFDGQRIVGNFPIPTLHTAEMRAELTRLRRDVRRV